MRRVVPLLVAIGALWFPSTAGAVDSYVALGHSCTPKNGVDFCPTANDGQRVPSFDGVPLDVDVTVPLTGSPPFPTIVMLHGFPGSKKDFETTSVNGNPKASLTYHWNNLYFAKRGYAVVTYSARGFGRSCGAKSSRTKPACNKGWFHFADQRYEVRDTQFLLGKLADQGLTDPARIGITGVSYGGGQSMQLAFLKNRVRTTTGKLVPWKSPGGKLLKVAAAWPRWGWSDFADAAAPNGRFLDYRAPAFKDSVKPIGVPKKSVLDRLYLGGVLLANLAPAGADPTADLKTWKDRFLAGEPYGSDVKSVGNQFLNFKSSLGLGSDPAPLLIMNGWTDPIFPATQAIRPYNFLRKKHKNAPVSLQLGDLGHFRGGNALKAYKFFDDQGSAFLDHYVKGTPGGPVAGAVSAVAQGCPKGKVTEGILTATTYGRFALGSIHLASATARSLGAGGKKDPLGAAFDPVTNGDPCSTVKMGAASDSIVLSRKSPGFILAGATTVTAHVSNNGKYGQIDARLWDVNKGTRRLIDRGTYRLKPKQKGKVTFQLFGNEYRFAKNHRIELELVGHDSPMFLADKGFKVKLSNIGADVPTLSKPDPSRGIGKPPKRG